MKTAVSVLQELVVKLHDRTEYTFIVQKGPTHCPMFEYRCQALDVAVTGFGRSKKEAKQDAAQRVLGELAKRGYDVPAEVVEASTNETGVEEGHRHVALLQELCLQYRLPAPSWRLIADTGPAHYRRFEVTYSVGAHERHAAASTKKAARQAAASALYSYLHENLARFTHDFAEETALVSATARAANRVKEVLTDVPWRPNLAQCISDYHTALVDCIDEEMRQKALTILQNGQPGAEESALEALGLVSKWDTLEMLENDGEVAVCMVSQATPPIAMAGCGAVGTEEGRTRALHFAREYLLTMLQSPTMLDS